MNDSGREATTATMSFTVETIDGETALTVTAWRHPAHGRKVRLAVEEFGVEESYELDPASALTLALALESAAAAGGT